MKRFLAVLACTATVCAIVGCVSDPLVPQTSTPPTGRTITWQDEFDGPVNTSPNAARWGFDIGTDWGNSQLEYDTSRPENCSLDGSGHLRIIARQESWLGSNYTSARIQTKTQFAQAKGRFEARIMLPVGQGIWPAFWLLGNDIGSAGWPACGEIDIMEYRGQQPTKVAGSLHGPGYYGGGALTNTYTLPTGSFAGSWHVFAVEWETGKVTWLVDDVPYQTRTASDVPPSGRWVFEHPFFIILNVAVGGNYVGAPDGSTVFPQTMLVDYVRVYQAKS
ncbi:MAG: glycoside hydrolase family 16 protein [Candidatus Eisenbacteria bacterium]|uniref:Glycoside hydrolase family 16 protein n=1 Tax=Eiseniibacteriota bacterium TaxID=2212470 RepID=A0A933SDE3_UNCEI|nr:glycoside hydrolase family 16 protein [Candidatus Eisenbacteria bacterium]